jgi:hypothetical protein
LDHDIMQYGFILFINIVLYLGVPYKARYGTT